MTHLVCHHSLESRGTTSNNGRTQSPVPQKFRARAELIKRNKKPNKKRSSLPELQVFHFLLVYIAVTWQKPWRGLLKWMCKHQKEEIIFSVFHEYDETFTLMGVMMWYLITRHIAGSVLIIWSPFILHAFRAMQREAILQKHGRSNLHGLNCPWHTACKWGKSNLTLVLPFLPILVTHVGIRTFSERQGIREKETHCKILNPIVYLWPYSLFISIQTSICLIHMM